MSSILLRDSIGHALRNYGLAGASVALGCVAPPATAEDATQPEDQKSQALGTIVVTGSYIRRVDIETSNPIITIDRATVQRSGKLTLGDLVQDLPAVTGPITNPRVNNGGGDGASTVGLRGLDSRRTLVLVNGHRVNYADVNTIPVIAIERIEVLTDGASSVYGSDAVAGVVNFILRRNYQGAEFSADFGISDRDDGQREGYRFTFGQTTDNGSIMGGIDYNKQEPVLASARAFSKDALYLYYGHLYAFGSSRTPTDQVLLPANLRAQFGCSTVTLKQLGSVSVPPALNDYRCYKGTDAFNYQAVGNLELTPQERTNAFIIGNYKLTANVEVYLDYYHNKTQSAMAIAPQPIDSLGSPLFIAANSYYNPFGVEFSNSGYRFKTRTIGNGNRISNYSSLVDQVTAGLKGTFGDARWQWNLTFNYGHLSQISHTSGFINLAKIGAGTGPSFLNADGVVQCGTPDAPIDLLACQPINFFDIVDLKTVAALATASGNTVTQYIGWQKSETVDVNGDLWDLPAGTMQLAAGVVHSKYFSQTVPDSIQVPDPGHDYICDIGTGCVTPLSGAYSVKEAYAELLVPILKDMPLANALNLTVGDRYSKYSNVGSTNNAKFAVEWRPVEDLLLRGTVSSVFRAPTVNNIFGGASSNFPQVVDPCYGLVGTNAACAGVPGDGSFAPLVGQTSQILGISSGAVAANFAIGPEYGKSFDWGFVYDPHWIPRLSLSVDVWRIYLNDEISRITAQNALNLCFLQNGGRTCPLIHRQTSGPQAGQISFVNEPIGNIGRLDAKGADLQARYRLPETPIGKFAVNFQTTYLDRFADDPAPGTPGDVVQEFAGHYSTGASAISYANFSRWKALGTVNWNLGPWSAAWTIRYIGRYVVGYASPLANISADGAIPQYQLFEGASVYHNVTAGYGIEPLNTRIDVGIDNLADKQPQILTNFNTLNGNVDERTFDTVGRYYWARVTVKF